MALRQLVAIGLLALAPLSAAAETDPMHGFWLTENGKAIVKIAPCGGETCGNLVWIDSPRNPEGDLKRDVNNSNLQNRNRPLCGLTLVGGLRPDGSAKDGWIYNPRDGSTYSVAVEPLNEEKLKVRGYLGFPLLGSSQVWTRVSDDRGGCGV